MRLQRVLFPPASRVLPAKRWAKIGLRTAHLVGVAGLGGVYLLGADDGPWQTYMAVTVVSGVLFLALELWTHGVWLVQVRGQAVFLKLALFAALLATVTATAQAGIFIAIVVIASIISHAPGDVRYHSFAHGRRIGPRDLV